MRALEQSIGKGIYTGKRPWAERFVQIICEFDFSYEYTSYSVGNPDLEDCFDIETECDEEECFYLGKRNVVSALKDYLLEGGTAAKRLGSAAYPIWQKALMDFEFTYKNFKSGLAVGDLSSFFSEIDSAARMTHVDSEIAEHLKKAPRKNSKRCKV